VRNISDRRPEHQFAPERGPNRGRHTAGSPDTMSARDDGFFVAATPETGLSTFFIR